MARRNINEDQKTYLIGKRYQEEKKEEGRPKFSPKLGPSDPIIDDESTAQNISKQSNVSPKTVKRAEKFANAVDEVAENVGINPQRILSGEINGLETIKRQEPCQNSDNPVENIKENSMIDNQEETEIIY